MTEQQSKAQRLAEWLQSGADDPMWSDHTEMPKSVAAHAAAELRRLHEENSKLRREVAAISANAVDDGRAMSKLEAQLGEAVWNYGEVKRVNAQLLEALELALRSHGVMLLSDPPQDAWKTYGVEAKARAAIAAAKGEA